MRTFSPRHWFAGLPPAAAARFLVRLECAYQHDWRLIRRRPDRRLALQVGPDPDATLTFGQPDQNIASALRWLNQQLSPEIFSRFKNDPAFRSCVILASAQALLDDDVEVTKGLLRRMVDATVGFETLGELMEVHPKSLIRMLSRMGNPSARHLVGIQARMAYVHGVRLTVARRA